MWQVLKNRMVMVAWLLFARTMALAGRPASRGIRVFLASALVLLCAAPAMAWRSELYPADWQSPTNGAVDFQADKLIQDFSYAGYKAGEAPLPSVSGPVFTVTQPPYNADNSGANDATSAIQAAINAAQTAGGGVVSLPAGRYAVSPQGANAYALLINASNIVLRGAGTGATFLLNTSTNMRSKSIILVSGPSSAGFYSSGSGSTVLSTNLLGPAVDIPVASTNGFAAGQWVVVRADCTDAWITEHNEPDWLGYGSSLGGVAYFRRVLAVSPTKITLNVPTRYYLKTRDNARVVRLGGSPLSGCGLEDFSIGNVQHGSPGVVSNGYNVAGTGWAENDYTVPGTGGYDAHNSYAIQFTWARDSWARNVATFQAPGNTTTCHLLSNGIGLNECTQITLTDLDLQRAQYGGGGGNGYLYRLSNSSECLVENCRATFSRSGFVLAQMSASGNVFLGCTSTDSAHQTGASGSENTYGGYSDHHMHFSHANLVDACTSGNNSNWEARYRPDSVPRHALTSAHGVFWNTGGVGLGGGANGPYAVRSEQSRYGYVIGTRGTRTNVWLTTYGGTKCDPVDHVEGIGQGDTLEPVSLYADQLQRRLNLMIVAAGGSMTISNTVVNYGGLTIEAGGVLQVVNGTLIVGNYGGLTLGDGALLQMTNSTLIAGNYTNTGTFTLSMVTNIVTAGVGGAISPSGTNTMISTWSDVTYFLTAAVGYGVGSLTNNGVVTHFSGTKTATYTDPASNITNNQIITAAFVYNGVRFVPGDYGTITGALAAAQVGDQIVISSGTYAETLVVSNNVTLVGSNVTGVVGLTVLSNQTLVLSGFTSFAVSALAIQPGGTLQVSNSTVTVNGVTMTGTFILNSQWGTSPTPSSLNFSDDFESCSTNMPLALCGGQGWGASDSGSIIQGLVFTNGAKAAMVAQSSTLSNVVVGTLAQSKVWTDLWLNDSAVRYAGVPYPTTNANRAVMLFVNTNNHVVIWNSNAWDECVSNAVGGLAPTVATGTWVRVSVFQDFTAQKVALFVNGQLLRQQVPFMSPMASYHGLSLSAGAGSAYMDDVKIWTNMPSSLTNYDQSVIDLNHDGIADAVQISQNGFTYNPPMMAAPTVSAVRTNGATFTVSVTNDGGTVVTSWGTAWDTNLNPTAHMATILGSANAPFNFTTNVAGFSPGQHYYVRGWASNVAGIAYSPNGEFYAEPMQATNITYVPVPGGFTISWTPDVTSTGTVMLVKQGAPVDAAPEDGSNYVETAFGSDTYLGVSNYIVYVGSGSNVTVNNLIYRSSYQVAAFAYAGHDNLTQYRTNSPPTCILVWPPRGSVLTIR
jgi:hypothetical protein